MRARPFRPGFDHTVDAPPAAVCGVVEGRLGASGPFVGQALSDHLMLTVQEDVRHFWSPYLHLHVEAHRSEEGRDAPSRSYVRGFFTPHPSLWSAFMLAYLACASLAFFAGIWGLTQIQLGQRPFALALVAAFAGAALVLWALSRVGRRLAAEQMEALHAAVEQALGEVGVVSAGGGDA